MQFPRFGYTVVIGVLPQTQGSKDRVVSVSHAIGIAVASNSVRRLGLGCEITEQFTTIIDCAVAIAVQDQERVIGAPPSMLVAL